MLFLHNLLFKLFDFYCKCESDGRTCSNPDWLLVQKSQSKFKTPIVLNFDCEHMQVIALGKAVYQDIKTYAPESKKDQYHKYGGA